MSNIGPIPTQIVDPKTGSLTDIARRWFYTLFTRIGGTSGTFAPTDASYIIKTADTDLTNAQVLGSLNTGFMKVAATTGVITSTGSSTIGTSDLATTAVTAASYGSSTQTGTFTVGVDGRLTAASNVTISGVLPGGTAGGDLSGSYPNPSVIKVNGLNLSTLSAANASALLLLSGTNTGDQTTVSGNSGSTTLTAITDDTTTNAPMYLTWVTASSGNQAQKVSSTKCTFNPSTGKITATGFIGALTGNADTVTTNANLTGDVTSVGNATTIGAGKVTEAMQVLADNTTNNVSITKHGYAPKAPNDATKYLDGTGAYSTPAGTGTVTSVSVTTANGVSGSVANATTTPTITLTLGAISPTSIAGITDGSNAAAGKLGEVFTSTLALASATSVTTLTAKTVTSITVTAGRWLIFGVVGASAAATTTISQLIGAINTTTNALPADESQYAIDYPPATAAIQPQVTVPSIVVSVNASTTYYLVARVVFATSTCAAFGRITAVRI